MSTESIFPINEPFYETRKIETFKQLIDESERLFSDRPAYKLKNSDGIYYDVTYKKFRHDIYYIGNSIIADGLSREKIAVIGQNSYNWCVTYLAVTCSNNIIVPIDKELMTDDIVNILKDSDSVMLFGDSKYIKAVYERKDEFPEEFRFFCLDNAPVDGACTFSDYLEKGRSLYKKGVKSLNDVTLDKNALASLIFTSGTTGMSKGVCLSQYNICSDLVGVSGVVKVYPEDQLLSVLPLHHTYECTLGFLLVIYSGACIAFCQGLRYITKNMQEVRPTVFITVPLMIEKIHGRIMKKLDERKGGKLIFGVGKTAAALGKAIGMKDIDKKIFSEILENFGGRLRLLITGAAALDPRVAEDFIKIGIDIYIGYGLTECSPLVIGNHDKLMLPDSVGTPLPGVEAKIHNPDDLGVGEIWVKGPMVMLGYYNNQKATDEVMTEDGWFRTGDLGTVDRNNCYKITGRCKNVIVTKNGKNIFPEEVEQYLNNSPVIEESLVFGDDVDDETLVSAKIYPNYEQIKKNLKRQELTKEEIRESIAEAIKEVNKKLPRYKKIMNFDIRENEFIKTTTQKIKRYANLENRKGTKSEETDKTDEENSAEEQ
ncbi:MAG: AMP-binding protein [Oscillospiraceae bacterium]|nr:AMP-binding protein [Oscillospiraceae bacterium]